MWALIGSSAEKQHEIDMSQLRWLDANMCAPLGAVLHRLVQEGHHIGILGVSGWPKTLMQKNGFLFQFGWERMQDRHETTIEYRRFLRQEKEAFQDYIIAHFKPGSRGLPGMSDPLLKAFRRSLFELYNNTVDHSVSELGIFACGQFFPGTNRLDFSIADLGIGIRERIRHDLGKDMSATDAISWAMGGNTTKTGKRPGGLGLKLIREFIELNMGRVVVVADAGYWEFSGGESYVQVLEYSFPGTVVTIEINAADKTSYRLKNEVDPNAIW